MAHALTRRLFISRMGKAGVAVAIFGVAACSSDEGNGSATTATSTTGSPTTSSAAPTTAAASTTTATSVTSTTASGDTLVEQQPATWERVILGNVSAYVLARGGTALIVDTGNPGSADQIESVLSMLDVAWSDVAHVVLTHLHRDHIGSATDVMNRATGAAVYAGEADISSIPAPRPIAAVADGEDVFGLLIVETPGHTAGHISAYDPDAFVLVAGDSLNGADGGVVGANPQFTPDMATANESIKKMAALGGPIERIFFGHGEPVLNGGGTLLRELAAAL